MLKKFKFFNISRHTSLVLQPEQAKLPDHQTSIKMKLIRFGQNGREKPGLLLENTLYDLSALGEDYNETFFESGGLERLKTFWEKNKSGFPEVPAGARLGIPVARPSKIVCVGLNYATHALESGFTPPPEPILFLKASSSLCGAFDNIVIPKDSEKTDWEVELAVVIGKKASYVSEADAMDYVAGYALFNDVSERSFQLERAGGQWDKGKSCDTFAPMGPFMATRDEITDVHNLRIWLKINGKIMQDANTANLIFKIPRLVSDISRYMTLLPGDVIATGTPSGVGLGLNPPVYLKAGDVVELGIDGLGMGRQVCVAYASVAG